MAEALYVARARLENLGSLHRRAHLSTGERFDLGVQGPIAAFYRLVPERALPLPVDYIVAATGG